MQRSAKRQGNAGKKAFLAGVVVLVTVFHKIFLGSSLLSIFYRDLYFLAVILGGLWFGLRGGVGVSLLVSLLYLPALLFKNDIFSSHELGNFMEFALLFCIGGIVGWMRDREVEYLRRQQKIESLAAMGKAASCIAHDMKTPLIAIGGLVRQLRKKTADNDPACKKLDFIVQQTERLEVLVRDILAFAKPLDLQCQFGSLNEVIKDLVLVAKQKALAHNVTIVTRLSDEIPFVSYDPHRLQQALLNLINNAIEASPAGGEITVRTERRPDAVHIDIIDQGMGISQARVDDIFTPFHTSKKDGTGLGLSIAKKVIDAHCWSVSVAENSHRGVTFRVTIPLETPKERRP